MALKAGPKLTAFVSALPTGSTILDIINALISALSNPQALAFLQLILSLFIHAPAPSKHVGKTLQANACCPCSSIDELMAWLENLAAAHPWFGGMLAMIEDGLALIESYLP